MKLIFIYGPPAVGKLTVAKELAQITGYKVFHNHLTLDLVNSIFEFDDEVLVKLVHKYRLELIETAARKNIGGLIFTYVYAKPNDDEFVAQVVNAVEGCGGEVCFVQLTCGRGELEKRVGNRSRKNFRKLQSVETLREVLAGQELFSSVPYARNLIISNEEISAEKAAKIIKDFYQLP